MGHPEQDLRLFEVLAAVSGVADEERVAVAFAAVDSSKRLQQRVAEPERGRLVARRVAGETGGETLDG